MAGTITASERQKKIDAVQSQRKAQREAKKQQDLNAGKVRTPKNYSFGLSAGLGKTYATTPAPSVVHVPVTNEEALHKLYRRALQVFSGNHVTQNPMNIIYKTKEFRLAELYHGNLKANERIIQAHAKAEADKRGPSITIAQA